MKKMLTLVGLCCATLMAQDWDSVNSDWDSAPAEQPAAQPAEAVAQPAAQPAPAAPAAEQAQAPAAPQEEGLQWSFSGDAQPAPAAATAPAAEQVPAPVPQEESFVFSAEPSPTEAASQSKSSDGRKKFFVGVFASATYNDFYDTKLGLGSLGGKEDGYTVRTSGAGDLMGNFWGIGYTAGLSVLYMPKEFVGVHAEVGAAYRWGQGESNMSVIVDWDDESRLPEKADIDMDYYVKQIRIDLPIMARFALPNIAYLDVGPMASFAVYSKSRTLIDDDFGHQEFREHDVSDVFEFDIAAGVGTTRYIGSKALDVGLRLVMGITPLNDASDAPKTLQGQFNLTFWFL